MKDIIYHEIPKLLMAATTTTAEVCVVLPLIKMKISIKSATENKKDADGDTISQADDICPANGLLIL